jgi:hypothetical protein
MTPGGDFGLTLVDLVRAGDVPESRIDDMVRRCGALAMPVRQAASLTELTFQLPQDTHTFL